MFIRVFYFHLEQLSLLGLLQLDREAATALANVVLPAQHEVLGHQLSRSAQALNVANSLNSILQMLPEPRLAADLLERAVHGDAAGAHLGLAGDAEEVAAVEVADEVAPRHELLGDVEGVGRQQMANH